MFIDDSRGLESPDTIAADASLTPIGVDLRERTLYTASPIDNSDVRMVDGLAIRSQLGRLRDRACRFRAQGHDREAFGVFVADRHCQ